MKRKQRRKEKKDAAVVISAVRCVQIQREKESQANRNEVAPITNLPSIARQQFPEIHKKNAIFPFHYSRETVIYSIIQ